MKEHNYEERVKRGVAWLDKNVPLWEAKIEMQDFDLGNPCRCVLGFVYKDEAEAENEQLREAYGDGDFSSIDGYCYVVEKANVLGIPVEDDDDTSEVLADFGFDLYQWEYDTTGPVAFKVMQEKWERIIKERVHA